MDNFTVCFNAVFPAFLLMLIGYLTKRAGIISQEMVAAFNKVVFNIFMPFMVFYNLYNTDIANAIRPNALLFCILGVLLELVIGILYAEKFVKKQRGSRGHNHGCIPLQLCHDRDTDCFEPCCRFRLWHHHNASGSHHPDI